MKKKTQRLKAPKDMKDFIRNLDYVIGTVPINKWAGVYVEAGGDVESSCGASHSEYTPKSTSGCLMQYALTGRVCRKMRTVMFDGQKPYYIVCDAGEFEDVAPFLKGKKAVVSQLVAASDNQNITKAIAVTRKLAKEYEVTLRYL